MIIMFIYIRWMNTLILLLYCHVSFLQINNFILKSNLIIQNFCFAIINFLVLHAPPWINTYNSIVFKHLYKSKWISIMHYIIMCIAIHGFEYLLYVYNNKCYLIENKENFSKIRLWNNSSICDYILIDNSWTSFL